MKSVICESYYGNLKYFSNAYYFNSVKNLAHVFGKKSLLELCVNVHVLLQHNTDIELSWIKQSKSSEFASLGTMR